MSVSQYLVVFGLGLLVGFSIGVFVSAITDANNGRRGRRWNRRDEL
jgi:hypothetical protein